MLRTILVVSMLVLPEQSVARPLDAQTLPVATLQTPDVRFDRGFTHISDIHQFRDGRVLAVDAHETSIYLLGPGSASARWSAAEVRGLRITSCRHALKLTGDSIDIVDNPNARLLVVSPAAEPIGVLDRSGSGAVGAGTSMPAARHADGRGYLYATSPMDDGTFVIERWRVGSTQKQPIATFGIPTPRGAQNAGGFQITRPRPFNTETQWAVSNRGTVAVVRPNPYQVTLFDASGTMRRGPSMGYTRRPVTQRERRAWREEQERPRPVQMRMRTGGSSVQMVSSPATEPDDWPRILPPFAMNALRFGSDGTLWVERAVAVGEQPLFDVFDERGQRVRQVRLPAGARLVGFGPGTVYLVRKDSVDLEYLERYPLPR